MVKRPGSCLAMLVRPQALLVHITWPPSAPNIHTHLPNAYTFIGAVNISNIFPFSLRGRQQSSRSSQEHSPSLVMICFTLLTASEMKHSGKCHCVWGTDQDLHLPPKRWSLGLLVSVKSRWLCRAAVGRSGLQNYSIFSDANEGSLYHLRSGINKLMTQF